MTKLVARRAWVVALGLMLASCDSGSDGGAGGPAADTAKGGNGGAAPLGKGGSGGAGTAGATGKGGASGPGSGGAAAGAAGAGGGAAGSGVVDGGSAGAGGSSGRADAGADRGGPGEAGNSPGSDGGGTAPSADLDQRCTVPVGYTNTAMDSEGAKIFAASIPDVVSAMQAHARAICKILYRKVDEVKNVKQQRLTLEANSDIAFASGGNITFSTNYIAQFARGKGKPAIDAELNGVLVHEGAHVWQYTNGGGALVEAMADYVRYKAGFYTLARRGRGGNWNDPYTTGGFFIAWVEEKYDPDYGYKLNMGMKAQGFSYPQFVQQITGKSIDSVWADYQAAIK